MKNNSLWFRHDVNASIDSRLLKLRGKFQWGGVGAFWFLVESLYNNDGYLDADAMQMLCSCNGIEEQVLAYCVEVGLLSIAEDGRYFSKRLVGEIKHRHDLSAKRSKAAARKWQKKAKEPDMQLQSKSTAIAEQVSGRREEESREEKNTKAPLPPTGFVKVDETDEPTLSTEELERRWKQVVVEQQWCDIHYAEKTWTQGMDLATDDRERFLKKVRVTLNSAGHARTLGFARKVYHETAGIVNDRGAMQRPLNERELANRRAFGEMDRNEFGDDNSVAA